MKNLYLTICLILLSQTAVFSQYLVQENKIWSTLSIPSEGSSHNIFHIKFENDTTLNGIKYKKAWKSEMADPYKWYLYDLVREDSGKVYLKRSPDRLLYDFTLNEGDVSYAFTQPIDGNHYEDSLVVDSVRYVTIDGKKLKHLYLKIHHTKELWVENIGSLAGVLINFKQVFGADNYLLCVKENGKIFYQNPKFNSCDTYTSVKESLLTEQFVSLYQDGSGDIQIVQNNGSKGKITFLTPDGKQVLSTTLIEPETTLCAPTTGLLLYRFVSTNGQVQTGKVLVR